MDISFFKEFVIAAETLNFRETARKLNISQSAISRHIAEMERIYGTALFLRDHHQVLLTPEGALLYIRAEAICEAYERSFEEIGAHGSPVSSITVSGVLNTQIYSRVTLRARRMMGEKGCTVHPYACNFVSLDPLIQRIRNNKLDLLTFYYAEETLKERTGLELISLAKVPLEVIVHKTHPLTNLYREVELKDLADTTLIRLVDSNDLSAWNHIAARMEEQQIAYREKPVVISQYFDFLNIFDHLSDNEVLIATRGACHAALLDRNFTVSDCVALPISKESLLLSIDAIICDGNDSPLLHYFISQLKKSFQLEYH